MEYVGCIILFMPFTKYQASGGKFLYLSSKNMSVVNGFNLVVRALIGGESCSSVSSQNKADIDK